MRESLVIFRRELKGYFYSPIAYVFGVLLTVVLLFISVSTSLVQGAQASMQTFFGSIPLVFLLFLPALTMRLWAEERKTGTIELFLTLPVSIPAAVTGKFLAAWAFCGIALALTFPLWLTVRWLGDPDHGVIIASYVGSFLMAGAFLSIGACMSAMTRNQVIAFVLGAVVCFLFTVSGSPIVINFFSGWAPQAVIDTIASFSFLTHFSAIVRGAPRVAEALEEHAESAVVHRLQP